MHRPNPAGPSNTGNNGDKNWKNRKKKQTNTSNNPDGNQRRPRYNANGSEQHPRNNPNRDQQHSRNNPKQNNTHQSRYNRVDNSNRQPVRKGVSNAQYFNFHRLDQLSNMNSDDVITVLSEKETQFEELLNNIYAPDILVVTLRILNNVCVANFTVTVTNVLINACCAGFLNSLVAFLTQLPFESLEEKLSNKLYHQDINRFWSNLIQFFKKVMQLLPTTARDVLTTILQKIHSITKAIETSQKYKIDEKIVEDAYNMFQELEADLKKIQEQHKSSANLTNKPDAERDPPEDFRSLGVIPTVKDLFDKVPFIRPCKIKDAYDSVEHYLDVQFRLLREDFVSPLRSGIEEYLHGSSKNRNNELRIYKKVMFIAPEISKNKVGITVSFGVLKFVNWKASKRFMFGGLLLLSNDNFETILFVTVVDRDERQLAKGFIVIEPCPGTKITSNFYNTNFVMLESKIYFEPYLAVLNAMQHMNEQNFPMTRYLVNADTSRILPRYLAADEKLQYKTFTLPIGADWLWPTATEVKLDETQYNAFKTALTQEFAVIQGPPGTGKTFIALEIVRTLLENERLWKMYGPIIVICLTNHALDQFLEGILGHTDSIVRVGSRSKSEVLKPYTLGERRNSMQSHRRTDAWHLMYNTKREIEGILSEIERTRLSIKLFTTANAIVPLRFLQEYCQDIALSEMKSNDELVNWLVGINVTLITANSPPSRQPITGMPEETVENDETLHVDDELELNYKFEVDDSDRPIFPLQSMDALIASIYEQIVRYRELAPEMASLPFCPSWEWQEELRILHQQRDCLQRKLAQHPILNKEHGYRINARWKMYWTWVKFSYDNAINKTTQLETTYRHVRLKLDETKQLVDLAILREFKIIGLSTNAAARLHASLRALSAPIVLVEEAAEILEAHVVCSMTQNCQHVILIGDHKQLRPKASVYKLGTKYNLNVSLFERMVNIRGNCTQLAHQHRMRPQIAKLICPSIYETLYNHDSVLNYPDIKGLNKNVFFLNHNKHETSHNNEESWVNPHEATFLIAFARHLILQGYSASEITILCLYTGQLFALIKERDRYSILKRIRVTTVDNYQGEENTIILLSLVRNNGKGNIGFLKEENRVCVALSRAREGLYIMGNMDDLTTKNEIWPKIKQVLEADNAIGDSLELHCQIHADQSIQIQNASDFQQKCPEGGCSIKCDADLSCGHSCASICHILDREHKVLQCKQDCIKSCINDHPCPLKCWMECMPCRAMVERQLECGHTVQMPCFEDPNTFKCYIEVDATLPDCNHKIKKPCSRSIENCKCLHLCENRLPCGHTCRLTCHVNADPEHIEYLCYKDCTKNNVGCINNHPCKKRCHEECKPCSVIVEKTRSCGHYYKKIKCSVNPEDIECPRRCVRQMSCGHKCKRTCAEKCENCQEKVEKISSCGHKLNIKCCEEATPAKCNNTCTKKLACGHPCTAKCKEPCITFCKTMVRQSQPGLCGHIFSIPCYLIKQNDPKSHKLLKYCKEPCRTELACEHLCKGTCGTCNQGRIHTVCAEPCGHTLICGHQCDIPCRTACQPCKKPCEVKCCHSKCGKQCGEICTPCKEPCTLGCEHAKCNNMCFELCDIEPCNEPCKIILKCKHPCIGFCGDPCPPLCRICDNYELTQVFFLGDEDEPDARFVLLGDCSHCIEINGLLTWLSQEPDPSQSQAIQMKTCPRCKTPIRKCMRIINHVKKVMKDLDVVKNKIFGTHARLKIQQEKLLETVSTMFEDTITAEFEELRTLLLSLWNAGIPVKKQRQQILHSQSVDAFGIVLQFLQQILDILAPIKNHHVKSYQYVRIQVVLLIKSLPTRGQISNQEMNDITLEIRRLRYMAKFCILDANTPDLARESEYPDVIKKLLSIKRFTEAKQLEIQSLMEKMARMLRKKLQIIEEQQMVRRVMAFGQGHWFKCPNGHIYAIADCGGATVEGKCIECKATVGGANHRLRDDNNVATEMDGATRPAWPGTYR